MCMFIHIPGLYYFFKNVEHVQLRLAPINLAIKEGPDQAKLININGQRSH